MTSYKFEEITKNAVVEYLRNNYIPVILESLELVWFKHELEYKKYIIGGIPMSNKYAEVIYNKDKNEMYLNIYQKNRGKKIKR